MEQIKLSQATLSKLSTSSDIKVPQYDRRAIKAGIFHFGVGNFHRAHQALIMDNLFAQGLAKDYGICGVGVMQQDSKMRDILRDQDYLYTLVEKAADGKFTYRVIGSIIDYIFAPDDVEALIERLCTSDAKIVTLTITEGGYNTNPSTNEFDLTKVEHDLKNPSSPKTAFGIVVEALRRRKVRKMNGFTVLSCDNLQENGKIARKAFCSFARAVDSELAEWIIKNVTFPNSMVDRITPVTTDDDRKCVAEKLKLIDSWPVVCEDFIQWVIEDKFVSGRPPFEKHSAVQIVDDVEPYEFMKLRLINAGHQAIAYFGLLLDFTYVHHVTQFELIENYLNAYMDREATSTLRPVAGIDVAKYKAKTVERFQNANILDTLMRLAFDGSDRVFKFVIPGEKLNLFFKQP
jgi:mannitol 2-dehydrogenase